MRWGVSPQPIPFGGSEPHWKVAPQSPELSHLLTPKGVPGGYISYHGFFAFVQKFFVPFSLPLATNIHIPTFFFGSLAPVLSNEM